MPLPHTTWAQIEAQAWKLYGLKNLSPYLYVPSGALSQGWSSLFFVIVFQAQIWTCGVLNLDGYLKLNFGFEL